MARAASNESRFRSSWASYSAALWALLFGALHLVWAAGWYVGLPEQAAREAFQRTWFWAYDITAAVMCVVGAIVVLALLREWKRRSSRKILTVLGWCGTGLLVLRGGAGIIKIVYLAIVRGREVIKSPALWEVWFCIGAILFSLAVWQSWRVNHSR